MKILVVWFLLVDEWMHARALLTDLAAMKKRGHEIKCIFPVIRGSRRVDEQQIEIDPVCLPWFMPIISLLWFCLAALMRVIREHDVDAVVVEPSLLPLVLAWMPLRLLSHERRSALITRETSPPVEVRSKRTYYLSWFRYVSVHVLSRWSAALFAVSPMHKERIVTDFGISSDKVHVWPSSVDADLFSPDKYSGDRCRIRTNLDVGDKFLLLYHGSLSNERGLFQLLTAMHLIHGELEDVALLLLGKGPGERKLRRLASSLNMGGFVIFHSPVDYRDVPKFIAAADAGVVPLPDDPQWRYQVPTKLLEYASMAKRVIATDTASHRWIVAGHGSVFFCGRGSPQEIASAVIRCVGSPQMIGHDIREEITTRFSSVNVTDGILEALANLIRSRQQTR